MKLHQLPEELALELIGVEKGEDKVRLPTLSVCGKCGGYRGVSFGYGRPFIEDRELAYEIALMRYSRNLQKWGSQVVNREFIPAPCHCTCKHNWDCKEVMRQYYRCECTKCGEKMEYDSSD